MQNIINIKKIIRKVLIGKYSRMVNIISSETHTFEVEIMNGKNESLYISYK